MKMNNVSRRGGVTGALLALVLLILVTMAAIWLVPSLRTHVFGRDAITPEQLAANKAPESTANPATSGAVKTLAGTITAVRSKEGLPTFCLFDLAKNTQVAPGANLEALHAGQAVATLLVESVTEDGESATARLITGALPVVGDTLMLKP